MPKAPNVKDRQFTVPGAVFTIGLPLVGLVAGGLINAYSITAKIATKDEVAQQFIETKKYADERIILTLKDAVTAAIVESKKYTDERILSSTKESHDYSDNNRTKTLLDVETKFGLLQSEQRAQSSKIESILNSVEALRSDSYDRTQLARRRK